MSKSRASIFGQDGDLDISGFAPKKAPDANAPAQQQVKAVAEASNFRSREPKRAGEEQKRARRQYRTGRNVQFAAKASQKTVDAIYAVCDQTGWVLGETLEYAIAALRRDDTFKKAVAEQQSKQKNPH